MRECLPICLYLPQSKLTSSSSVYIKTDQIDGETDLKLRKPLHAFQEMYNSSVRFFDCDVEFVINLENYDLNSFDANINFIDKITRRIVEKEPLSVENTVWSGCQVNKSEIYGLVIAVGRDTRLQKNSRNVKIQKITDVDKKVNMFSIILFVMMVVLSVIDAILQGTLNYGIEQFLVSTTRFVILLSFLIPISLKLFLMIGRFGYSSQISSDEEIEGTVCKTETIVDDLGKIEVILSDKTGTITQNEMYMDKIAIRDNIYDKSKFKSIVDKIFNQSPAKSHENVFELSLALVICNNVNMKVNEGKKYFDASSPDEIAMVEYFENIGFEILVRDDENIRFKDINGREYAYRIVEVFPFESAKKRMGIIVEQVNASNKESELLFFVKGADIIMKEKVNSKDDKLSIEENTLALASEGLRTLVFAYKELSVSEYEHYKEQYKQNLLKGNKAENVALLNKLELNLNYVGITAVKDLLQEDVPKSFAYIEQALVKMWILTGDKLETAKHICVSTGLAKRSRPIKVLTADTNDELMALIDKAHEIETEVKDIVLMIDGDTLAQALYLSSEGFLRYCYRYNYVCFARCTPAQKYMIAYVLKNKLDKIILAVGDGGNDVGMIQIANIGVGIHGKEGNQAALAADFTISKFNYLCKLVLFHGRAAHRGVSSISQFILHRGLIISWLQQIFSMLFYMISMPIFNGIMMVGYSSVFTVLPVLSVIYDVDISWRNLKDYLNNYKHSGKGVSVKNFMLWCFVSVYQACAIFMASFMLFDNYMSNFVGITFTALILAETFNIVFLVSRCTSMLNLTILVTIMLYVLFVAILPSSFDISLFDVDFCIRVSIVFIITWLPVFLSIRLFKYFNKDVEDLVN